MSKSSNSNTCIPHNVITVDVIIPVHNAEETLEEAVHSVFNQVNPYIDVFHLDVAICAFDDASNDNSLALLHDLLEKQPKLTGSGLNVKLLIDSNIEGLSRGAGYARNRASRIRNKFTNKEGEWLCLLDSDDVMKPLRIAEQIKFLLCLNYSERKNTICGCQFERLPTDATWHYTSWANNISDERLVLEQFREVTVIQPTWMLSREWFHSLGGYIEAPTSMLEHTDENSGATEFIKAVATSRNNCYNLIRVDETYQSLRLAEDLRLFHSHLASGGHVKLLRCEKPLVLYRHRDGMSQSSQTSRSLLLKLRIKAFEDRVLKVNSKYEKGFCVWGAGRDGKAFIKTLNETLRSRIVCIVDIDPKKIRSKFYINNYLNIKIPIVHFTKLNVAANIDDKQENPPKKKLRKETDDIHIDYGSLPVVVCVAMYRTKGELEQNVKSIGRTEGIDLWHFN